MATVNKHYYKLAAGYLFPEIAQRTEHFLKQNPGLKIMRLGIGDTTEPLPPSVIEGLHQGVDKLSDVSTYTGYGAYEGEVPIREAIIRQYGRRGVSVDVSEIFVSDGAKPDSGNIQSIFGTDNRIAVQDPVYPVYIDTNVIAGRTGPFNSEKGYYEGITYMVCNESNGFFPSVPEKKVDLIYLCSPNNPTGCVATKDQLSTFVDYANQHRSIILFDAAYSAFIQQDDLPRSIYEVEGAKSCAIEINSFSKSAGFTGVRLGWSVVPEDLIAEDTKKGEINALWRRRQCTFFNGPSNVVQAGGIAALSDRGMLECQQMIDYYMENARLIKKGLQSIDITVYGGDNAPYIWMKTPKSMRSWDFFDKLLHEAKVVGTPGSGFGPSGEGFFRLSAFGHRENIIQAIQSIKENLKL
ncbi:LL-diaminopimelate aminotransferase [bacterium]|nr:LL-diaminopimelate aminotransferase [bacterium]